jgi:ABC-type lipoprotein export system ATPase subunit
VSTGILCRSLSLQQRLEDVSATFAAGAISLVSGPIGAGKTTLLHVMSGLLRPTSGEVVVDGEAVSRYVGVHRDRWRRQVGIAFQAPRFLDQLGVVENVMVPLVPVAGSLREARRRAAVELERLELGALAERDLASLSGGERQRVGFARAMVGQPRFLFADEPTAHQDAAGVSLILRRLGELRDAGAVVVVASHDARVGKAAAIDHAWLLEAGRLVDEAADR